MLGTSMRVSPACDLPRPIYTDNGGKLVICNLQKTPYDEYCALRVWGRSDAFMKLVMEELGESVRADGMDMEIESDAGSEVCFPR